MRRGEACEWRIPLCGDTSGARAYERAASGWRDAGAAYEVSWKSRPGAPRERAAARSAARRCAWARRSAGTATTIVACRPQAVRPVASVRRRAPDDTERVRVYDSAGEEAEVADADEALREDVQEKSAQEFVGVERERADLAPVSIVLPPKRDGVVGDGDEPVIRDGDAVGVSREVVQALARAAEGRLRVDHPRVAIERSEPRTKGAPQWRAARGAREMTSAPAKSVAQAGDEFARERPAAAP